MKLSTFKTWQELLESDYEIITEDYFHRSLLNDSTYLKAIKDGRIKLFYELYRNIGNTSSSQIWECIALKAYMKHRTSEFDPENYYILPERVHSEYTALDVGYMNPFLREFQRLFDLSFEAGLFDMWATFQMMSEIQNNLESGTLLDLEKYKSDSLDFSQILPICVILLIGHSLSLFVFLCEIFYFDFLRYFGYFKQKFKERKSKLFRRKVMKKRTVLNY